MLFKKNPCVIFRDYEHFGLLVSYKHFAYGSNHHMPTSDSIISTTGSIIYKQLTDVYMSIEEISQKVATYYDDIEGDLLKHDVLEFLLQLSKCNYVIANIAPTFLTDGETQAVAESPHRKMSINSVFEQYGLQLPRLNSVHMEIASKCNERCIHCYIPHEDKTDYIKTSLFDKILNECKTLNVLHFTITGGEPMLHPNFCDFLRELRINNFAVSVLSNLTLLSDVVVQEMKLNPLLGVQTSVYSMDEDIHDSITQVKGSLVKTLKAIELLKKNGIPIQISCPIMKQNYNSYESVKQWGLMNNIAVNADYVIIGKYNGSTDNLKSRLSLHEIECIYQKNNNYVSENDKSMDSYICDVGGASICIAELGLVYPCGGWQSCILGSTENETIERIWYHSDQLIKLRGLKRHHINGCADCPAFQFCEPCLVRNANESYTHNPLEKSDFFCEIAKIKKHYSTLFTPKE